MGQVWLRLPTHGQHEVLPAVTPSPLSERTGSLPESGQEAQAARAGLCRLTITEITPDPSRPPT